MRERGYTEGKNVIFEYRFAEGNYDRLPDLAADLVQKKVNVIVTTSSLSAQAARKVTSTVPIVMTSGGPIERGLAESLAKPGGKYYGSDGPCLRSQRQTGRTAQRSVSKKPPRSGALE